MAGLFQASLEDLALPGFGEKKIKRVWDAFHQPFVHPLSNSNVRVGTLNPIAPAEMNEEENKNEEIIL